jgi:acetyl esterase/lipase
MKRLRLPVVFYVLLLATLASAQQVIPLYSGPAPGSPPSDYPEKEYFSKLWNTEVVANVTKPTLTVFKPSPELSNGTAIVICPGGGFLALSINSEGNDVAKYLVARGVTAFVLRYRVAHTGEDATQEFASLVGDLQKFHEATDKVIPLAVADGLAAVKYVRQHAADFGVSPERVGIIGFSAGGAVTAGVGYKYAPDGRPAFVAPIYAVASMFKDLPVPEDAPPIFLVVATDDQFHLVPDSITLYQKWTAAHKSAELHIYAKGGHGFGARPHGIPTDHWIDRFAEWMEMEGWMKK